MIKPPGVSLVGWVTLNVTSLPISLSVYVAIVFALSYLRILAFAIRRRSGKGLSPVRASAKGVGTLACFQTSSIYVTGASCIDLDGYFGHQVRGKLRLVLIADLQWESLFKESTITLIVLLLSHCAL